MKIQATRFILFDPKSKSYIKIHLSGWTSGHGAADVNSYASLEEARKAAVRFDSLQKVKVLEVAKTVEILNTWELV